MDKNAYTAYINEHIRTVKMVWEELNRLVDIKSEYSLDTWNIIHRNVLLHDQTKYDDIEFEGYCQYFYATESGERDETKRQLAWNHHQKFNPHHWEHWLLWEGGEIVVLEMPLVYIIEMLCDWGAMSVQFDNDVVEWYYEKQSKVLEEIVLGVETRAIVEGWLPIVQKAVEAVSSKRK